MTAGHGLSDDDRREALHILARHSQREGAVPPNAISPETCRDIRTAVAGTKSTYDVARELDISQTTVRRHRDGDCHHEEDDDPA